MKNMRDKKELLKELTLNNPNLSATNLIDIAKQNAFSYRKTEMLKTIRETKGLSEPSQTKREKSVPIKYRTKPPKPKKKRIPFEKTKFGKMTKTLQNKHNISEKNAIERLRKLLKIPRLDYDKLNQIDYDILTQYGY